jgi:hypothetical protein
VLWLSGSQFYRFSVPGKVFIYAQPLITGELVFMLWLVIMGAREQRLAVTKP